MVGLGRVPYFLRPWSEVLMTMDIEVDDKGVARLTFARRRADGKKPPRILWSVAPAMKCFLTDRIVLYAEGIRQIWSLHPGETVVCDRFEYDQDTDTYEFWLNEELQAKLQGGRYVLPMEEFAMTDLQKAEDATSGMKPS